MRKSAKLMRIMSVMLAAVMLVTAVPAGPAQATENPEAEQYAEPADAQEAVAEDGLNEESVENEIVEEEPAITEIVEEEIISESETEVYDAVEFDSQGFQIEGNKLLEYKCSIGGNTPTVPDSVKIIGRSAFCNGTGNGVTSVTLPKGLEEIESGAFRGSRITRIVIPDGVTTIGSYSFADCVDLVSVSLPDSVTTLEEHAFYNCTNLTTVDKIPSGLTTIRSGLFDGCSSLSCDIVIPNTVTAINGRAFEGCSSLVNVTLPDKLHEIGEHAFEGCGNLAAISLPETIYWMSECAFKDCTSLTEINIPGGELHGLSNNIFEGCTSLSKVTFTERDLFNGVQERAFKGCTSLEEIELPVNTGSIDSKVFEGCTALKKIVIHTDVKEPSNDAFEGITNSDFAIYGWRGSNIEKFAGEKGIAFRPLDDDYFVVRFVSYRENEGGSYTPHQNVKVGDRAVKPDNPTREGYTFIGWFERLSSGSQTTGYTWDFDTPITRNTILDAGWVENGKTCTVTFQPIRSGFDIPAQKITNPGKAKDPGQLSYSGYTFLGWHVGNSDGTLWDFDRYVPCDMTLYAKWVNNNYYFVVTFDSKGGSHVPEQKVARGESPIKPYNPSKAGYSFGGWYRDEACTVRFDFDRDRVTEDMTLYARWIENEESFTVNFNTKGGSSIPYQRIKKGGLVKRPADPVKLNTPEVSYDDDDFTFEGWYKDFECTVPWNFETDTVTKNTTLYAKWTQIPAEDLCTVTFSHGTGLNYPEQKVKKGGHVIRPADPYSVFYVFAGWYSDKDCTSPWDFDTDTVQADMTLYAKWSNSTSGSTVTLYIVTFDMQGHGAQIPRREVSMNSKMAKPVDPTEDGYTFGGWFKEAECTNEWKFDTDKVEKSMTLYAKWSEGGTDPVTPDPPVTPSNPTAKYTVTISGGGTGATSGGSYVAGSTVRIYAGEKPDHVFTGWTASPAVSFLNARSLQTSFPMPAGNVTVTANWKAGTEIKNPTGTTGSDVSGSPIADAPESYATVSKTKSIKECTINNGAALTSRVYTGKPITHKIKIKDGSKTLKEGTDYRLTYLNNTNAGKASVLIMGVGSYGESVSLTFDITGKPINKLKVVTDSVAVGPVSSYPIHIYDGQYELVNGQDYTYTFTEAAKGTNKVEISHVEGSNYTKGSAVLIAKVTGIVIDTSKGEKLITESCVKLAPKSAESSKWTGTGDALSTIYDGTSKVPEVSVKVDGNDLKKGTDYTVSFKNNKNAGTAYVIVKGKGKTYKGQAVKSFAIKSDAAAAFTSVVINKNKDLTFTGKALKPAVTIKVKDAKGRDKKLSNNKDYTLSYRCNVTQGPGYVTVTGLGNYAGIERSYVFNILPKDINKVSKKIKSASDITLKFGGKVLEIGDESKDKNDYTVTVVESAAPGKMKVTIKGYGNFTGTIEKDKLKP